MWCYLFLILNYFLKPKQVDTHISNDIHYRDLKLVNSFSMWTGEGLPLKVDGSLLQDLGTCGPTEPHHGWETKYWIQIPGQPLLGLGIWSMITEMHMADSSELSIM